MKRGFWEIKKGKFIHYMKAGKGNQSVIFLHGLPSSMDQWTEEMKILSRDFSVYAFSFPGFGLSDILDRNEMSARYMPIFIDKFVKTFDIRNPIIVGGSFGGFAAIEYVRHFKKKIRGLVLVNSVGMGREVNLRIKLASIPVIGELIYYYLSRSEDALRNKIGLVLSILRTGVNIFGQKNDIIRLNFFKNITVPVLLIHGRKDEVFPVEHSIRASRIFPNAKLHVFYGFGHKLPDGNVEEFCEIIRDFVLGLKK